MTQEQYERIRGFGLSPFRVVEISKMFENEKDTKKTNDFAEEEISKAVQKSQIPWEPSDLI